MYHCYFTYFETETESQPRVDTTKSWNYPNLKAIMKDLNNRWVKEKVPLKIKEDPSGRVVISHNMPHSMGSLASLKLSPNLAYMLGYTSEVIKHGQFLRFDENKEFLAPHEPKLFMDFCDEKIKSEYRSKVKKLEDVNGEMEAENVALKQEFKGKLAKIEKEHKQEQIKIEERWKSYTKTKLEFNRRYKLAPLEEEKNKLRVQKEDLEMANENCNVKIKQLEEEKNKLRVQKENLEMANENCNEKIKQLNQKLKDYSDRVENGIIPIKDFDKFYWDPWVIKGVVLDKQWIEGYYREFNITIKDYSGTITIKAYDDQGELLDALSVKGKEYYISNVNGRAHTDLLFTVHNVYIRSYFYRVMFHPVN